MNQNFSLRNINLRSVSLQWEKKVLSIFIQKCVFKINLLRIKIKLLTKLEQFFPGIFFFIDTIVSSGCCMLRTTDFL